MDKIFLIDGHAQIFRMYYAFMRRPMINSKGVDTSILFGFTKMVLELILREHPTHLAVSFDPPAKTFRHEAYPAYKANRGAAPESVKAALEPLQEILHALRIPVVMIPGYEADDVIGSMAHQWENGCASIYMVTPDKDYGQLITPRVFQYKLGKNGAAAEIIGPEQLCEQYGISRPEQIIDMLAIWGDASDNVPGIRGVGEVGARKLIARYGSVGGLLEHSEELPPKMRAAVEESREQIGMSRFLVTIKTDIELPVSLAELQRQSPDYREVAAVFDKYEFNSLRKLMPDFPAAGFVPENTVSGGNGMELSFGEAEGDFPLSGGEPLVSGEERGPENECPEAAERTGLSGVLLPPEDGSLRKIVLPGIGNPGLEVFSSQVKNGSSVSLKLCGEKGFRLCTLSGKEPDGGSVPESAEAVRIGDPSSLSGEERKSLAAVLENPEVLKIGYDIKNIIKRCRRAGLRLCGYLADIELMHYLINPERSHKISMLLKAYLEVDPERLSPQTERSPEPDVVPDLFNGANLEPEEDEQKENMECALLLPLYRRISEELEQAGMKELYESMEMPLIEVLAEMEEAGVKIDTEHLKQYSRELTAEMNAIEAEIREMAGEPALNISSPKQIGTLLYEKLNVNPKVKKSSRGNYPTDEETLNELQEAHPVVNKILEYRGLKKLLSTYIDNFPALISPLTGKIHTTFNQALTATGRLSSNNPNLQNIPIRTDRGKEIRKAFIPSDPDGYLVSADYSQIELRLMAHLSGDPGLIDAFVRNRDIHTATAAKVFKETEEQVTREQRSRAKVANFGIIYGISAFGLSQRLGMSRSDSKALIEEYFKNYPGVREYMDRMIAKGRAEGYVETLYGRKRFLPDINSRNAVVRSFNERNAINAPLQGSAADIIKVAMIRIHRRLKEKKLVSRMVLQVHDELVFDVPASEKDIVREIVRNEMENAIRLQVPLIAECNYGKNWLEAH